MLTNLTRLSVESDGRYATTEELLFLNDYFNSLENRLTCYEKLSQNHSEILDQIIEKSQSINNKCFQTPRGDMKERCKRDLTFLLRATTAALLFNDTENLQEDILIWHSTIIKSFQLTETIKIIFDLMNEVLQDYLTPEEMIIVKPFIYLNKMSLA